ncbi:SNAP-25 family protein [Teladorsagia circumcincta]|uniref:Synaptosomal-associated protein n=1 Tax=Teladorsagia circumcincta TaxID=45464 RepID=A0A2G9UKG8_TELCI|nr:SNAP-25 family protein [Teladorsagia circumcincta]
MARRISERFVVDSTVATTSGELETKSWEEGEVEKRFGKMSLAPVKLGQPARDLTPRSRTFNLVPHPVAIMADDIPDSLEQINLKMNATTDEIKQEQLPTIQTYLTIEEISRAAMADRARRAAPADDGTVRINGIVLPADMSDELKTLNVKLEDTAVERKCLKTYKQNEASGGMSGVNANLSSQQDGCSHYVRRADDFEKNSEYAKAWKKDDDGGVISDQPRITVGDSSMGPQGGYVTRITNDAREDEMDENIQQVSTMVGNLRNMAIDMSTEVSNQNRQLDRIHDKDYFPSE